MDNAEVQARYTRMAAKNRWEEQGFFFDDSQENYGLEPTIYRRLSELGWFYFARQPARANLNWVLEFYTNNVDGEDNITVRGRRVAINSATINNILGLPNNDPSIYALLRGLEDEDYKTIKDFLCEQGTEWNTTGKNPHSVSHPSLRPEAKLWNTFVKRNLMPTSHNQTIDRTRLVLIHVIMIGYSFNVGEVIAQEIAAACQNEKGILAFPCIISALCRRAAVPTSPGYKYTTEKSGWSRKEYMRKMDVANATPIRVALPTPPTSPAYSPAAAPEEAGPSTPVEARPSPAATPQSEEAPPLHILQLRSQLQWIEERQLQFQEETKVFLNTLKNFHFFQFPSAAAFFAPQPAATPHANHSATAQLIPSANPSVPVGDTEEVHPSSDDENDIFDWQSPRDFHNPRGPTPTRAELPESSTVQQTKSSAPTVREVPILSPAPTPATIDSAERTTPNASTKWKGKTPASRTMSRIAPSSPDDEEQLLIRPAKRQRRYHVITVASDDDSSAGILVDHPE
ncbi:hypothetical protein V6N13_022120 [Hibiscus sabdariffa]